MKLTTQGNELSIAILMDDLNSAKEISSALRNLDFFSYHYQSLDEFWAASHIQLPDLLIIDVTKMSLGEVQFRNHPKVKDGSLSYVFFSKDSTKLLLNSTLSLRPYGYLYQDPTLSKQVESIVQRRQREIEQSKELRELEQRVQRLQNRSQRMISEKNEAEEFKSNFEFIKRFSEEVKKNSHKSNFIHALSDNLENWDVISGYGFYELAQSGQRLVSPNVSKKKSHPFPALWLGQVNTDGIEKFAEEMASQVADDLFEKPPICLKIFRGSKKPEVLLFLTVDLEQSHKFPWSLLEYMLSGAYGQAQIDKQSHKSLDSIIPAWEALDKLDKVSAIQMDNPEFRVIGISLVPVCELAKTRVKNKFFWEAYFNEFRSQFSQLLQKRTQFSFLAPYQILVFIHKDDLEMEFNVIQMVLKEIPIWKFFEDDSQVFTKDVSPAVKLIPSSSAHFLRLMFKEIEELSSGAMDVETLGPSLKKSRDKGVQI